MKIILHESTCIKAHIKFSTCGIMLKRLGPGARQRGLWILSLLSFVTFVKWLSVSQPQFLICKMGVMTPALYQIVSEIKQDNMCKVLPFLSGTYKVLQFTIKFHFSSTLLITFHFIESSCFGVTMEFCGFFEYLQKQNLNGKVSNNADEGWNLKRCGIHSNDKTKNYKLM